MTDSQKWMLIFGVILLGALVYLLAPVITPFLIATLLAYFFNPIVDRFHKWHLSRTIGTIFVLLFLFAIILGIVFLIIPVVEAQLIRFFHKLPEINQWIGSTLLPWLDTHFHIKEVLNLQHAQGLLMGHLKESGGVVAKLWKMISHSGMAMVAFISNVILVPVVMFYILRDWHKIAGAFSEMLPRHSEKEVVKVLRESGDVLGAFLRGQLLVMLGLGIIYAIGLWIVGLEVGLLIGLLAGLLSIVPYLGFITGILMALVAAFFQFHDVAHLIYVVIVFCVGEAAESFLLVPLLVGDRVGLHPVAVIFFIMAFGALFGFVGVLLAVPISAVLMVFCRHLCSRYKQSHYYR